MGAPPNRWADDEGAIRRPSGCFPNAARTVGEIFVDFANLD
jgi:hypothetical protein